MGTESRDLDEDGGSEPRKPASPRRRGLGKGLGAIIPQSESPQPESLATDWAPYDALTGLPNRILLDERMEDALAACQRDATALALLFVDLDGLSIVNELFGHRVGDLLLRDVGKRLVSSRRRLDTVARFGGDEFVIICPFVESGEGAARIATTILEEVSRPMVVEGIEHVLTASVGVVVTETGAANETGDRLLGNAELAMRHAKRGGRASWRLFEDAMRDQATIRYEIRRGLLLSLDQDEIAADYEPIVNLQTGLAVGAHASLRWGHDVGADVRRIRPADLIRVADEADLAESLRLGILECALGDVARWRGRPELPADFRVWVGVTVSLVSGPGFAASVEQIAARHAVPLSMVGLELSDPVDTIDEEAIALALRPLVGAGVHVVLSDFGTGRSNLGWLTSLPVTGVKLAPEIVSSLDSPLEAHGAAMVRGLIGLGRGLGLSIVGGGVETEAQAASLRVLGCDFAQGPFFGSPEPPERFWSATSMRRPHSTHAAHPASRGRPDNRTNPTSPPEPTDRADSVGSGGHTPDHVNSA